MPKQFQSGAKAWGNSPRAAGLQSRMAGVVAAATRYSHKQDTKAGKQVALLLTQTSMLLREGSAYVVKGISPPS